MKPLEIPPDIAVVSHETLEKLRLYHRLLLKWQDKINLISPNTISDAWGRHFLDSVQIAPYIEGGQVLYDLGSGAGFAGMVFAIMKPDLKVTLIESDAKKCAFLSTVSRETAVNVSIVNERIEAAQKRLEAPQIVSARALASLPELFGYVWPWAKGRPQLRLVFPKGGRAQEEIRDAQENGWEFHVEQIASKTDPAAQILLIKDLQRSDG